VGDVGGGSHPTGRYRGEIGTPGVFGHVGVALDGDEAGRDRVHGDAGGGELTGPAAGQAYLGVLGGGMGRPARRRPVGDLGVHVHDAAIPPGRHRGQHRAAEQHRALDEEVQLGQVAGPAHLGDRASGCGPVASSTSTSTGPKRPVIAATNSATCCSSVTSAQKAPATPPSPRMARRTCSACPSPRRPLTATAEPSWARRRAITASRPRELPVTKATRRSATGMQRRALGDGPVRQAERPPRQGSTTPRPQAAAGAADQRR
jgi:hypothetical protein